MWELLGKELIMFHSATEVCKVIPMRSLKRMLGRIMNRKKSGWGKTACQTTIAPKIGMIEIWNYIWIKVLKDIVTEKWFKLKEAEKIQSSDEEMDTEG